MGFSYCQGGVIRPASNFAAQPPNSPAGGGLLQFDRAIDASPSWDAKLWDGVGGYANGTPVSRDLYYRFQLYFSADYLWPQALDNKLFFPFPPDGTYTDPPSASIDAGIFTSASAHCKSVYPRYLNDAFKFRVGNNSGGFKSYPAYWDTHCSGVGFGNSSPSVSLSDPPDDRPLPGRLFRFGRNKILTPSTHASIVPLLTPGSLSL